MEFKFNQEKVMKKTFKRTSFLVILVCFILTRIAEGEGGSIFVEQISLLEKDGNSIVTVKASSKAKFRVGSIEEPPRVFIDVIGARPSDSIKTPENTSSIVKKVEVEKINDGFLGMVTRIAIGVSDAVKIERKKISKSSIEVVLSAGDKSGTQEVVEQKEMGAQNIPSEKKLVHHDFKENETDKKTDEKVKSAKTEPVTSKISKPKDTSKPGSKLIGSEDPSLYEFEANQTASAFASFPSQVLLAEKSKKKEAALGGKISDLDFKDADIHNVLRLFAELGHVNIVVGDNVKGTVTLKMRNVPWSLALDVILEAKNLGKVKIAENVYRVAPKEELEKEQQMKIKELQAKKILKPLVTRIIPVSYAMASELKTQVEGLLSDRGSVAIDERTNVLIVRDVEENLSLAEQLVRHLDTQTPQVLIEARIVEAASNYSREIGIQWGGHFTSSTATGNPTGIVFPNSIVLAGGGMDDQTPTSGMNPFGATPNPNFAVNLPATVGTGAGGALGISLGSVGNTASLNLRLSALENDGVLKIISAPKILTLDNKEAKIEQGTMIPYSQISAQGVQTAFQEAKLSLQVTPHVTAEGSILMKLNVNRDEPDFNNRGARGDPTILKRHAETELLIEDGKTVVLGGIYTRNYGKSFNQVPFFSKIPVIGWLFKKRTDTDRRTELLIFITPRIVNRAESIGK